MLRLYDCSHEEENIAAAVFSECMAEYDIPTYYVDIDITMVSAEDIKEVNCSSRGVDKATDVLSFPFVEVELPFDIADYKPSDMNPETKALYLGEILICREIMLEQAIEYGHSHIRECAYLITHGIHHLLGYDHMKGDDKMVMREQEEKILDRLNYVRMSNLEG